MTTKNLAALLYDVACFTTANGEPPDQEWIEERTDSEIAEVYDRLLHPERLAGDIAEALLDAGGDLDFERYDIEPNDEGDYDAADVWDLLHTDLTHQLDEHDITGDERDRMKGLVHDQFLARY